MHSHSMLLACSFLGLAAVSSAAQQVTSAPIVIGGEGSWASTGTYDPGRLDDGATVASAYVTFSLDAAAKRLTVQVDNTSPVVPGMANPVLTELYFNVPSSVTEMRIDAERSSVGLSGYEAKLSQSAGMFGTFDVCLANKPGSRMGIGNPAAAVTGSTSVVLGPIAFEIDLTGDLTGVIADDFVATVSSRAQRRARVAARFDGGGASGEADGLVSQGVCVTRAKMRRLGNGCGPRLSSTMPFLGSPVQVDLDGSTPGSVAYFFAGPKAPTWSYGGCEMFIDPVRSFAYRTLVTDAFGDARATVLNPTYYQQPNHCGQEFHLQTVVFTPGGGVEISNGIYYRLGAQRRPDETGRVFGGVSAPPAPVSAGN